MAAPVAPSPLPPAIVVQPDSLPYPDIFSTPIYPRFHKVSIAVGFLVCIRIILLGTLACPWSLKSLKDYTGGFDPGPLMYGPIDIEELTIPYEQRDDQIVRSVLALVFMADIVVSIMSAVISSCVDNVRWITLLCVLWLCFMLLTLACYGLATVLFILSHRYITVFYLHLFLLPIIMILLCLIIRYLRKFVKMGLTSFPKPDKSYDSVLKQLKKDNKTKQKPDDKDSIYANVFGAGGKRKSGADTSDSIFGSKSSAQIPSQGNQTPSSTATTSDTYPFYTSGSENAPPYASKFAGQGNTTSAIMPPEYYSASEMAPYYYTPTTVGQENVSYTSTSGSEMVPFYPPTTAAQDTRVASGTTASSSAPYVTQPVPSNDFNSPNQAPNTNTIVVVQTPMPSTNDQQAMQLPSPYYDTSDLPNEVAGATSSPYVKDNSRSRRQHRSRHGKKKKKKDKKKKKKKSRKSKHRK